jgi:putative aldouronate transport system permease protein
MMNARAPVVLGKKRLRTILYEQRLLFLLMLPCLLWLLIFCYIPMGGIIIAFKNYRPAKGIIGSDWVGVKWFEQMFKSTQAKNVIKNTIGLSLYKLIIGTPMPILFALLLNEIGNKRYMKAVQTVSYLPHFLSWIIVIGMFQQILSVDGGVFNVIREAVGLPAKNFFGDPGSIWPLALITEVWKEVGWAAIIYIAALAGVDPQQYEAAIIDGANKLQRMWHISLPNISSTIIILLIMNSGNVLNSNFDQLYAMRNDAVLRTVEVIDTYVYQRTLSDPMSFSYSTAITLFKSVINVAMLLTVNFISSKVSDESFF